MYTTHEDYNTAYNTTIIHVLYMYRRVLYLYGVQAVNSVTTRLVRTIIVVLCGSTNHRGGPRRLTGWENVAPRDGNDGREKRINNNNSSRRFMIDALFQHVYTRKLFLHTHAHERSIILTINAVTFGRNATLL